MWSDASSSPTLCHCCSIGCHSHGFTRVRLWLWHWETPSETSYRFYKSSIRAQSWLHSSCTPFLPFKGIWKMVSMNDWFQWFQWFLILLLLLRRLYIKHKSLSTRLRSPLLLRLIHISLPFSTLLTLEMIIRCSRQSSLVCRWLTRPALVFSAFKTWYDFRWRTASHLHRISTKTISVSLPALG